MIYSSGKTKDLGGGFLVRRILPQFETRSVGPFVFLDHMGPVSAESGEELVVRAHPHIGLATVTYLYDGVILHRDSLGVEQRIQPYEVNWMTAGSGIVHSERSQPDANYQIIEGIQAWVALPTEFEETNPEFHHFERNEIPTVSSGGWELRVLAGSFLGETSPVKVFSSLFYVDLEVEAGAEAEFPIPKNQEAAIYIARGSLDIGGKILGVGELAVFPIGDPIQLRAESTSRVMILGGSPLKEPRHLWWNFVSSSRARIDKAKEDWKLGKFAEVPNESERIPLPEF
ncbi:pirin [Leptospira perolatii]|uniref:Pirin n=1 Tax=Leptospira perolatii TaxID=2023191 RepID=A0A2M9ZNI2_9LEPT|nr:pirin family protein [Leptospira perolatii]PJZ69607.1 pirin [Leptospira perolatii]PJZ73594.1 pirin [Leptospira perolatii]